VKSATILSSLIAGSLLLGPTVGLADRIPPPPPTAPRAPKAPAPPRVPTAGGGSGVHVQIDGLDQMIDRHIQEALDTVARDRRIPDAVRHKIVKRLEKVKQKVHAKAAKGRLDADDLEDLGEEIGEEMEDFGEEMEKWGEEFGKEMEKKFGGVSVKISAHDDDDDDDDRDDDDDDDDDHDDIVGYDIDDDDDDLADAIKDMGDLRLAPAQRDQIKKLREDSDAKVAAAKRDLDRASDRLQKQLDNPATSEADIARSIDVVTQQEATIRKARILAWHNARRILDDSQRKKVEGAAKRKSR
jgi:hypothetical protein